MKFRITLTGTHDLLMHNARLADRFDPITRDKKRITDKRKKTDEDYEEVARLEHWGGLYFDRDVGPYVPGVNIERCLLDAARVTRSGKQLERGVFITSDVNPLSYVGPRDVDGLWKDKNFVFTTTVVQARQRVSRCRPRFRLWSVDAEGTLDTRQLSLEEFEGIVETAGTMIGLGDWRPRYGRFGGVVEKLSD